MNNRITDLVVSESPTRKTMRFTIRGRQRSQNGHKLGFIGRSRPIVYDPNSRHKRQLRGLILDELRAIEEATPVFGRNNPAQKLRVNIIYYFHTPVIKDLDNMTKYLLDVMEGPCYINDKYIFDLHLMKTTAPSSFAVVNIETMQLKTKLL